MRDYLEYVRERTIAFFKDIFGSPIRSSIPYYIVRQYALDLLKWHYKVVNAFLWVLGSAVLTLFVQPSFFMQFHWFGILSAFFILWIILLYIDLLMSSLSYTEGREHVETLVTQLQNDTTFSLDVLRTIISLAEVTNNAFQHRFSLPAIVVTVMAALLIIEGIDPTIKVFMVLFIIMALLSFVAATRDAQINLNLHKAALIVSREREDEQRRFLQKLIEQPAPLEHTQPEASAQMQAPSSTGQSIPSPQQTQEK